MVKLSELQVKTVWPDADDTIDCEECKDPVGKFAEEVHVLNDNESYLICSRCGTIYKVKD